MKTAKALLIILFSTVTLGASAQKFDWNVDFETKFDNREYAPCRFSSSKTIFGAVLTPTVGVRWGEGSRFMAGVDLSHYFGSEKWMNTPEAVMFYNYSSEHYFAAAGMFQRSMMIGEYSSSIFGGRYRFQDRIIDGVLLQYKGRLGHLELGLDWDGMYSDSTKTRESFRVFSAGRIEYSLLFAGYGFSMYHLANSSVNHEGVVDNIIANPYIGVEFASLLPLDKLYLKLGWQQSAQRNRRTQDKFSLPFGGEIEIGIEKWGVGLTNRTYIGKNLFPLWALYGTRLYSGESFYSTTKGIYNRTAIYYKAVRRNGVDLTLTLALHYDGVGVGFQQIAQLNIYLNRGLTGKGTKFGSRKSVEADE